MKKNGRLVAIALGSVLCASCVGGAFLVAGSTPAAETVKAADATVAITITQDDFKAFEVFTDSTSFTLEKSGVTFGGQLKTGSKSTSRYNYLMFQPGDFIYNVSGLEGYYLSNLSGVYSGSTGESGFAYTNFASSAISSNTISGTKHTVKKNDSISDLNDDESVGYGNISTTNKNVQFVEITFTFSEKTAYDHISIANYPAKTNYYVGDRFLPEGIIVNAFTTSEDLNPIDVTDLVDLIWEPEVFEVANQDTVVTVMAGFGDLMAEATYHVNVSEAPELNEVIIESQPSKTSYFYGESINYSGLKVVAKYADGNAVDITAELNLPDHKVTFEDCSLGLYTLSLDYKGRKLELSFETSVEHSVADYRSLPDGDIGSFRGVVTGLLTADDYSLFLSEGESSILLYNVKATLLPSVENIIGKTVYVVGEKDTYNGLVEAKNIDDVYVGETGEMPSPYEIQDFNSSALSAMDSRLIHISGLTYVSGNIASGGRADNVYLKYGNQEITLRVTNNTHAVAVAEELSNFFDTIENLPFDFTGHLGWFNGPQLSPTSIQEFSCPDYDAVMAFVDDYMHPEVSHDDTDEGNACLDWYPLAKKALEGLTEAQQDYFLTSNATADYAARYNAWAAAYGEGATSSLGTIMSSNDTAAIIALVALSSATVAAAGFMIASRRRKAK